MSPGLACCAGREPGAGLVEVLRRFETGRLSFAARVCGKRPAQSWLLGDGRDGEGSHGTAALSG